MELTDIFPRGNDRDLVVGAREAGRVRQHDRGEAAEVRERGD